MAKKKSKLKSSSPKPKVSSTAAKPVEIDNQQNIENVQDSPLALQQQSATAEESETQQQQRHLWKGLRLQQNHHQ